ncbi:hypothetical protein ACTJLD_30395 [Burkholderia sp. 22088]|uniref:hypothetical protein n=1 Tax=Burkholderia sp. 22088 TaxID=3453871 RepID=UPI003F860845
MTQLMEFLVLLAAIIAFGVFMVRGDARFRARRAAVKSVKEDPAAVVTVKTVHLLRAEIAESRARTDLLLAATGSLLRMSEHREEIQQALRDVSDMLERKHMENEQYGVALNEALATLLEISGAEEPRDVN